MKKPWSKIWRLFLKYKFIILYMFFGAITTIINIVLYWLCYDVWHWSNVIATIIAWVGSVLFAFFSNKTWVFESRKWDKKTVVEEFIKFVTARLLTGLLDVAFMFIFVDLLKFNGVLMKVVANIFILISNYLLSRLIVFKK